MATEAFKRELKAALVQELNLVGRDPDAIADDAPLFGAGLGLDSLDALQIATFVEERWRVALPAPEAARPVLASIEALADYIESKRA